MRSGISLTDSRSVGRQSFLRYRRVPRVEPAASVHRPFHRRTIPVLFSCVAILGLLSIGQVRGGTSEFLIENWLAKEGLPENSALAVAQTPDGYLWVGSAGGLFRFNGIDFTRAGQISDLTRLNGVVTSLHSDRSGRVWAGTDAG